MLSQPIRHLSYVHHAEGTFLLLSALSTFAEMAFSILVCKGPFATVRTGEFAHIEHVPYLPAHFDLLKVILTEWAGAFTSEPLVEASAADESFAPCTRGEVFQYIRADGAHELLDHFAELGLRTVNAKLFEFIS